MFDVSEAAVISLILQDLPVLTHQTDLGHNKWFTQLTLTHTQLRPCEACHRSLLEGSILFILYVEHMDLELQSSRRNQMMQEIHALVSRQQT